MTSGSLPLTDLLQRARDGDDAALRLVFNATYEDLRRMAHARLSGNARGTLLDTTALVHESYLRFVNAGELKIEDRGHFFRYASHVMRSVIVDLARARLAERRGGDAQHVTLDTAAGDSAADDAATEEILRVPRGARGATGARATNIGLARPREHCTPARCRRRARR
jgi:RNA polymerase sigma factor (TIGR02999 family)